MTTYSVLESDPSTPDYTPESASTATAWSTGHKTADGRISTTAGSDQDIPTILEPAKAAGFATGDVTTSELTDATPAAPVAHVRARSCQGPLNMAACPQDRKSVGGPGSITEAAVDLGVDVLLAGGRRASTRSSRPGSRTPGRPLSRPRPPRATRSSPTRPASSLPSRAASC